MTSEGFGELNRERETVEIRVVDGDLDAVKRIEKWLRGVRRWMQAMQDQRDGGLRWEFSRPVDGVSRAKYKIGKRVRTSLELTATSVRRPRQCVACRGPITGRCWRQRPHTWGGHSRDRFCVRCVELGPASPPRLTLVEGGR